MLRIRKSGFTVFARIRGQPEKADELRQRLHELVSLTRAENGCLSCEMIENYCDSTEFTLLERRSDREAQRSHFSTRLIQNTMHSLLDLLSKDLDYRKHVLRLNAVKYGTNSYCLAAE